MTIYTLAGGCFWCLDAVFRELKGVTSSVCGYTGGTREDASYYVVASGKTGHAESVQVTFDERLLSEDTLLDIFFTLHDPTTLNRQGADVGPEYRSAMFYETAEQKQTFEAARDRAQKVWNTPIVTEITPLKEFYPAEPEHQSFSAKNSESPYCMVVIDPKILKVRAGFRSYFKD